MATYLVVPGGVALVIGEYVCDVYGVMAIENMTNLSQCMVGPC